MHIRKDEIKGIIIELLTISAYIALSYAATVMIMR